MTAKELIDLFQFRMTTSYNEQVWAVAIVGSLFGFLIVNVKELVKLIDFKWLVRSVWVITGICILFIFTRFGIYWHYSGLIDSQNPALINLSWFKSICRWVVLFSGTLVYTTVIIAINRVTILTYKAYISKQKQTEMSQQSGPD